MKITKSLSSPFIFTVLFAVPAVAVAVVARFLQSNEGVCSAENSFVKELLSTGESSWFITHSVDAVLGISHQWKFDIFTPSLLD